MAHFYIEINMTCNETKKQQKILHVYWESLSVGYALFIKFLCESLIL